MTSLSAPHDEIKLDDIKNLLDVIKTLTDKGEFISEEVAKFLGPIGSVAMAVKDLIGMVEPKPEDPVLKALGELKNQLNDLSNEMKSQFEELKAFELAKSFDEKYNVPLSKLQMFLFDTLINRKQEAVDHFATTYQEVNPQNLIYDMIARLLDDSLNPLHKAMDADHLMTSATFDKWTKAFDSIVGQALFLEKFASTLLPNHSDYDTQQILSKKKDLSGYVQKWNEFYKTGTKWWPAKVETFVHQIQDDASLDSDEKKLDKLWEGLQSIHTNNLFYAVCFSKDLTNMHIVGKPDQTLLAFDRSNFHVIVYRTPTHSKTIAEGFKKVFDENWAFKDPGTIGEASESTADSWFADERQFKYWNEQFGPNGLFLGVRSGKVASRWPKDLDGWTSGPGYLTYDLKMSIRTGRTFGAHYFPMYFLVAE